MTSHVRAERRVACPFSIVPEYTARFLRQFANDPLEGVVEVPLSSLCPGLPGMLKHRVRLRFAIQSDTSDTIRSHEAIRISWWSESRWLPNFSGVLRFRIAPHGETLLLFEGSYSPPFGLAGLIFDRLFGRHVASATARDLLERIGAALVSEERAFRAAHLDAK